MYVAQQVGGGGAGGVWHPTGGGQLSNIHHKFSSTCEKLSNIHQLGGTSKALLTTREAGLPTLQWDETASGAPHFWNIVPPGMALQLRQAPGRREVVRQGAGQLEDELPETTTIFETPLDGLCLFHALARVWNEVHPQEAPQTGQGMKRNLLEKMEDTPSRTVEGQTLAQIIKEDGWAEAPEEGHRQGTQQTQQTPETTQKDGKTR